VHPDRPPVQAPTVLPWGLVFGIATSSTIFLSIAYAVGGFEAAVSGIAALAIGLAGHALAPARHVWFAGFVLLVALGARYAWHGPETAWAAALILCALAGVEAATKGGRAAVLALYAWASLTLLPTAPPPETAVPVLIGGMVWGALSTRLIGMRGLAITPAAPWRYGTALTVFLVIGLISASFIARMFDDPHGYWVVFLFIFRALAPPKRELRAAARYVAGATLGAAVAYGLSGLDLPLFLTLPLAAALGLAGLRALPHPRPYAAGAFTVALLLGLAADRPLVLVRTEAAFAAVGLAVLLIVLLSWGWKLVLRFGPAPRD